MDFANMILTTLFVCQTNSLSLRCHELMGFNVFFPQVAIKLPNQSQQKIAFFNDDIFRAKVEMCYIYRINIPYTRFLFFICNNFVITVLRVLLLYPEEMFFQPYAYSLIFHISLLHASLTRNIHYMQINIPLFLSTIIEF